MYSVIYYPDRNMIKSIHMKLFPYPLTCKKHYMLILQNKWKETEKIIWFRLDLSQRLVVQFCQKYMVGS